MARPGISYEAVKATAVALLERGINPSVLRLREQLGTGSHSTIAEHLKRWQQEIAERPSMVLPPVVPPAIMPALEAFWRVAVEHAEATYQTQREQAEQAVVAAQQAQAEAERMQEQACAEAADLRRQIADLQVAAQVLRDELLLERERRSVSEAAIATAEQRAAAASQATEQLRQTAESQRVRLETALRRTREDAQRQLDELQQRFQQERERGEAGEQRLLQLIDRSRTEHAKERQSFHQERLTWQAREADWQKRREALQQDHANVRFAQGEAEERNRALTTTLADTRTSLQTSEKRYSIAINRLEALHSELQQAAIAQTKLEQQLHIWQQASASQEAQPAPSSESPP
jgi:DNA repair exonuclease SbcCD ATPase subunit